MPHHVFGDGGFGNLNAQFQQLTVNAWCTPAGVVAAHHPDQIPNLSRHAGSTPVARGSLCRRVALYGGHLLQASTSFNRRHCFEFAKEENSQKVLRKKIEGLISKASVDELQRAYRVLRALLEP
jgi:hypothetical protein